MVDLNNYTTEKTDQEERCLGCHLAIKEALKQNLNILCFVWDAYEHLKVEEMVCDYRKGTHPYVTKYGPYRNAEPILRLPQGEKLK